MPSWGMKLKGGDEFRRALETSGRLTQRGTQEAMEHSVDLMTKAAQAAAPHRKGRLAKSIKGRTKFRRGFFEGSVKVGKFYGRILEGGAKAHNIFPRKKRVLHWGSVYRASVHHPGLKPHPFFFPAVDRAFDRVETIFASLLDRIVRDLGR